MKLALILTNDWELFGDGSGDYFEVQQKPLLEFLELAASYSAKITLMAEVMQQFAHKEHGFNEIAQAWEQAVLRTVSAGSDVQLHIHPQWLDSIRTPDSWILNYDNWVLGKLEPKIIEGLLSDGKNYLENLIRSVKPDYNCNIFRAGAYCIEPSKNVVEILKKLNFKVDSSVTKGMATEYFDYMDAYSNILPWKVGDSVITCTNGASDLYEFPIYSDISHDSQVLKKFFPALYYRLKYSVASKQEELAWMAEKERIKNIRYPKENRFYKKYVKKDVNFYLKAILSSAAVQLDYDHIPASVFVKTLERIFNKYEKKSSYKLEYLPIIASGHFKDIHDCGNLERIFKSISNNLSDKLEYWTLTDYHKYISSK